MSVFQPFTFVVITDRLALTSAILLFSISFSSSHASASLSLPSSELSELILGCHLILFIEVLVYLFI